MSHTTTPQFTKPAAKPIPDGYHTVTPLLVCDGASEAIAFYSRAFGAVELSRLPTPEGRLLHAAIKIGNSMIMLTDEVLQMDALGPKKRGGTSVTIHLYFENAEAVFAQAVAAGVQVIMPLQDMFWGDRYGMVVDPFGHSWSIATHLRDLTPAEIQEAARVACGG